MNMNDMRDLAVFPVSTGPRTLRASPPCPDRRELVGLVEVPG